MLPHFYAPQSWGLPVELGLVVEFSFARPQFIDDTAHVEVRPIVQRRFNSFEFVFDPVFARPLRGTHVGDGWKFEPALRAAYGDSDKTRVVPYVEWYGELGAVPGFAPASHQVHLTWSLALGGASLRWSRGWSSNRASSSNSAATEWINPSAT